MTLHVISNCSVLIKCCNQISDKQQVNYVSDITDVSGIEASGDKPLLRDLSYRTSFRICIFIITLLANFMKSSTLVQKFQYLCPLCYSKDLVRV